MKIKVFETSNGWRADPVQLSGTPPNGTGMTSQEALDDLVWRLGAIDSSGPDTGYLRQMTAHGWPKIEVEVQKKRNSQ